MSPLPLYEQDRLLHQYLLFHFGSEADILAGASLPPLPGEVFRFPAATAGIVRPHLALTPGARLTRVLDVGCAVGRSSFEFSRFAEEVIGIDYSRRFIEAAEALRQGENLTCLRQSEGHRAEEIRLHRQPVEARPGRVRFETGDAMALRHDLGTFDLVHAANLLCRLSAPARFLERLPGLVNPGGWLVLATPATWMEEFTPPADQPPTAGTTLDHLRERLQGPGHFELRESRELPFLIREHERKFQLSTSQTSVWRRIK